MMSRPTLALLLFAASAELAACSVKVPAECSSNQDCTGNSTCTAGFCVASSEDAGGGSPDSGYYRPDGGAPAPGLAWQSGTNAGAFGDHAMSSARHKAVGSLSEPTPAIEGGSVEMKNSSHSVIGGFNSVLHSK